MGEFVKQDKLEFKQVVLHHLKKILDLSLRIVPKEYKLIVAEAYADAVRSFSDVLIHFYDEDMKKAYKLYEESFTNLTDGINKAAFLRRVHRKLFRELNLLMGRKDYLKTAVYTEGDLDDDDYKDEE